MKCLNCKAEMINNLVQTKFVRIRQISYDICESCGSLWLDAGELDAMAFQVAGSIEYSSKDTKQRAEDVSATMRKCPRCEDAALDEVFFLDHSEIVLDRCRDCGGFWLDGGELDLVNEELAKIMPVTGKGFSEFVNNAHLPYWYKRVRNKSTQTDYDVEVPPIENARFTAETTQICPACKARLNQYAVFGMEIHGCACCKGIFLDRDELRRLKDKAQQGSWRTLRWMDDEVEAIEKANAMPSRRLCPKCTGVRLVATNFGESTIILDWCPDCHGIWLDKDEYQAIVDYLIATLDAHSSADMKEAAVEEIREIWEDRDGKPPELLSEMLDAKAAISALISITIFEHPALSGLLLGFSKAARSIGL